MTAELANVMLSDQLVMGDTDGQSINITGQITSDGFYVNRIRLVV